MKDEALNLRDSTKKVFDGCADIYLREDKHWGCDLDIIARYAEKFEDIRVIELGTGYAWHLMNLYFLVSGNIKEAIGVDYSEKMLSQARKLLSSVSFGNESMINKIKLMHSDILDLNIESEYFDIVLMLNNTLGNLVGEDFKEARRLREKALQKAKALLKKEGYLILSVYNAERLSEEDKYGEVFELDHEYSDIENFDLIVRFKKTGDVYYSHWFTEDELRKLLYSVSFKVDLLEKRLKRIVVVAQRKI